MTPWTRRTFVHAAVLAPAASLLPTRSSLAAGADLHGQPAPRDDEPSSLLFSSAPAPHIRDGENLYAWLIGGWALDVVDYTSDGTPRRQKGECHFTWALEGRAIQDVWIIPRRSERHAGAPPGPGNRYGTTIRVYDPKHRTWRITWINAVTGVHNTLVGRKKGDDIVHEGPQEDGSLMRWTFTDITPTSFRWIGEQSLDQGKTWQRGVEFTGRRISSRPLR